MELRWNDYFLRKNAECNQFWEEYLKSSRDILFILGSGFDPRMCIGIESILEKDGSGLRHCMLINFHEGNNSPSKDFRHEVDENKENDKDPYICYEIIFNDGKLETVEHWRVQIIFSTVAKEKIRNIQS